MILADLTSSILQTSVAAIPALGAGDRSLPRVLEAL